MFLTRYSQTTSTISIPSSSSYIRRIRSVQLSKCINITKPSQHNSNQTLQLGMNNMFSQRKQSFLHSIPCSMGSTCIPQSFLASRFSFHSSVHSKITLRYDRTHLETEISPLFRPLQCFHPKKTPIRRKSARFLEFQNSV